MKRCSSAITLVLVLISCLTYTRPAFAAEQPNILIMGEDVNQNTLARNNQITKRVLDALANQMGDEGFNVFYKTYVALDDFSQDRNRRTDNEIIDIARSVEHPPIDAAVIFSINTSSKKFSYATKIRTHIKGRLLNIRTGQRLGNFKVEIPELFNASYKCDHECMLETVGKQTHYLSQDLGVILTEKLAYIFDYYTGINFGHQTSKLPMAYTLVFNGFSANEINDIEEYVAAFSEYKHHRPVRFSMRHAEYWYETDSTSTRLNRNLRTMLGHLGVEGRVSFAGDKFRVEKFSIKNQR